MKGTLNTCKISSTNKLANEQEGGLVSEVLPPLVQVEQRITSGPGVEVQTEYHPHVVYESLTYL